MDLEKKLGFGISLGNLNNTTQKTTKPKSEPTNSIFKK